MDEIEYKKWLRDFSEKVYEKNKEVICQATRDAAIYGRSSLLRDKEGNWKQVFEANESLDDYMGRSGKEVE